MRGGHPLVVAVEKRQEIHRQIVLVVVGQAADDAKIQRDIAPVRRHQDIAGVHVGMEKPVTKHLGEKNLHAKAAQLLQIHPGLAQAVDLPHRNAVHPRQRQHVAGAGVPEHFRHDQHRRVGKIAAQLRGIAGLVHQVQLVVQVFVELGHHFARAQTLAVHQQALGPAGQRAQQRQILLDHRQDAGAQHLHRHLAAVVTARLVHLRHRGAGNRRFVKLGKRLIDRFAQAGFDHLARLAARKRRHPILQQRQLVGVFRWQQVAAGGQHLAEFDKNRPQAFQRQPHPARQRFGHIARQRQPAQEQMNHPQPRMVDEKLVQAVTVQGAENGGETRKSHVHRLKPAYGRRGWAGRCAQMMHDMAARL